MIIRDALATHATASRRQFRGRELTVGASEIGGCSRKTYYGKSGVERDGDYKDGWGAAKRGSIFEQHFWVPALSARYGPALLYAGNDQRTLRLGYLSATPDGLLIDQPRDALASFGVSDIGADRCVVLEAKTIDPRVQIDEPKPEHVLQAITQLGLIREMTRHQPDYALISYTDASFWSETYEFIIGFDENVYAAVKARAAAIMTATSPAELKPEGWIAGGAECKYCAFTKACGRERSCVPAHEPDQTSQPDAQFAAEIADLAREAKRFQVEADGLNIKFRDAQNGIKKRLQDKGFRRISFDGISVTWAPVRGRPSYDMSAIREAAAAAGVDLTKFETTGQPSDRLVIQVTAPSQAAT
jgi:hypothetical protein